jgi:hypothetical protein
MRGVSLRQFFNMYLCEIPLIYMICRNFYAESFEKSIQLETMETDGDMHKILRPSLFMGHPLQYCWYTEKFDTAGIYSYTEMFFIYVF